MPLKSESPPEDRMTSSQRLALVLGITVPLLVGAGIVARLLVWRDTWEEDHRQELIRLSTDGQRFVRSGDEREAKQKYDSVLAIVGQREIHDPELAEKTRIARDGSARIAEREERDSREAESRHALADKLAAQRAEADVADAVRRNADANTRLLEGQSRAEAAKRAMAFKELVAATHSPIMAEVRGSKLSISYPFDNLYVAESKFRFGSKPLYVGHGPVELCEFSLNCEVDGRPPIEMRYFQLRGMPEKITFKSDAPEVVAVDDIGSVRAMSPGNAIVTVTLAGVSKRIPISVEALPVRVPLAVDGLIKALGLPDDRKEVVFSWPDNGSVDGVFYGTRPDHDAVASHWYYNRFPTVVFVIQDSQLVAVTNFRWKAHGH
jgi:hypothetical protein